MTLYPSPRSILRTPATWVDDLLRAGWPAPADVGLLDLRTSKPTAEPTAPTVHAAARAAAVRVLDSPARPASRLAALINPLHTPRGLRDLLALASCTSRPELLLLPAVEDPGEVRLAANVLADLTDALDPADDMPSAVALYPIIETPRALARATKIAAVRGVGGLVFDASGFAAHTGSTLDWASLLYARSAVIAAAATTGLPAIDSPTSLPWAPGHDLEQLRRDAHATRALGFTGQIAAHPDQLDTINSVYALTTEESAAAEELSRAAERAGLEVTVCARRGLDPESFWIARQLLAHVADLHATRASPAERRDDDPDTAASSDNGDAR